MNIVILERDTVGRDVDVSIFDSLGTVTSYPVTAYEDISERVKDADAIIANKSKLNESTLKDATHVKYIGEFATGYDNIDIEYCRKRGIAVTNVRGYSTPAVVQHTFALCFYVLEHLRHYDEYVKSGEYGSQSGFSNFDIPFTELSGKTWGIIGLGNIGKGVAKVAESFGCRVIYYSTSGKNTDDTYKSVTFDELLANADIISCHCPLNASTNSLINLEAMKKMKSSAVIINVARGPVVNNKDLYEALEAGIIAGAGLDVLDGEPITPDNPLGRFKNSDRLIITPHMAWASTEARHRCVDEAFANLEAYVKGESRCRVV